MKRIENFLFRTNVSLEHYESKEDAFICISSGNKAKAIGRNRMAFKEMVLTTKDFLRLATGGYCFCNLFDYDPKKPKMVKRNNRWQEIYPVYRKNGPNKGGMKTFVKRNEYFKGSQCIYVDIDYTTFQNIQEYISKLSMPPTCVYMSFSDNKEKQGLTSRRFRMVYVFERILGKNEFIGISHMISNMIVRETGEEMDDDCGTRMSQYFNGVYGNNETYCTDIIYSEGDFPGWPEVIEKEEKEIIYDEYMLWQMENLCYQDFMHRNSWRGYYYRTENPEWIDGIYQFTTEDYLAIWFPRERVTDGHHRRKKLFLNACLRALMFPDLSPDTHLFCLYVDMCRFFDTLCDDVIQIDTLKRRVTKALRMTKEELQEQCKYYIDYWKENRPKFIVHSGIQTTQGKLKYIEKLINRRELDAVYDKSKSVVENLAQGIGYSESTLYRYCKEEDIPTDPNKGMTEKEKRQQKSREKEERIKLFKMLYDPALSLRSNMRKMKEDGLNLSRGTIENYIKKYIPATTTTVAETYDMPDYSATPSWCSYEAPAFAVPYISGKNDEEIRVEEPMPDMRINIDFPVPDFSNYLQSCNL